MEWNQIQTEERNSRSSHIDALETIDMLRVINEEDKKVAEAVEAQLGQIALAVDTIADQLKKGGRLVYCGCGTSGRLGVLDAAECPPTFSTEDGQIIALLAGGEKAMFFAVEGAEDSKRGGEEDLRQAGFCSEDVLVGITASGRTPYVIGAMEYALRMQAHVIGISCCPGSPVEQLAEIAITPVTGPEVITGSTRMKCGTAQKLILNMLSTGAMIRLGKVYENLMVDVRPLNEKLRHRSRLIVSEVTGITEEEADGLLTQCGYHPKQAIIMQLCGTDPARADFLLKNCGGRISSVLSGEA